VQDSAMKRCLIVVALAGLTGGAAAQESTEWVARLSPPYKHGTDRHTRRHTRRRRSAVRIAVETAVQYGVQHGVQSGNQAANSVLSAQHEPGGPVG
jgi:hypothetical protein